MAAKPPPEPNKSVDLKATKAASSGVNETEDANDTETDGGVFARPTRDVAPLLPHNVQMGLPPCNPRNFNQFLPGKSGLHVFNIHNSNNVQIGHTNVMNFALSLTGRNQTAYQDPQSDSSDSDEEQIALEEAKIQELRRCEREISNIELQDIAQHVGLGWRRLVRFLGIQDYDVDEMYEEYGHHGLEEVIYQLLKRWKNEEANATVAEVLYQLQRCEMGHLARHLRDEDFHYTD